MVQLPVEDGKLRGYLLELCSREMGEVQLAQELVASDAFEVLLAAGACDSQKAAEILGYKSKRSVESMSQKSPHFPQPRARGSLWSVQQLQAFAEKRGRSK